MRILIAYNDTPSSQKALELAMYHSSIINKYIKIYVITSLEDSKSEKDIQNIDEVRKYQDKIKKHISEQNIDCETHILIRGVTAGEDIVEFANENNIDHIYIGIMKESRVGKFIIGSTAQYVILKAKCAVVSIK